MIKWKITTLSGAAEVLTDETTLQVHHFRALAEALGANASVVDVKATGVEQLLEYEPPRKIPKVYYWLVTYALADSRLRDLALIETSESTLDHRTARSIISNRGIGDPVILAVQDVLPDTSYFHRGGPHDFKTMSAIKELEVAEWTAKNT